MTVGFTSFEDWWEPFTMGVGPAGDYVATLDAEQVARASVAECRSRLPEPPFELTASAWAARAYGSDAGGSVPASPSSR